MTWFNVFRSRKHEENDKTEVPFSTIMRWALYDLAVESPNEVAVLLGLTPVSDEGDEKEEEDSHLRLAELEDLLPFIDIISELNAKIISSVQRREFKETEGIRVDSKDMSLMEDFYKTVGFSALVSAFSTAIELGIIHPHAVSTGSLFKEIDDE